MNIQKIAIPKSNYYEGRAQFRPEFICIHIGDGSKEAIIETFQDPNTFKSSHYLVCKDGSVIQFVDEHSIAYTQGIVDRPTSKWVLSHKGINPNNCGLSVEHEGIGSQDITEAQYATTTQLVKEICTRWAIPIDGDHIIRHRTINAGKLCPGLVNVEYLIREANKTEEIKIIELKKLNILQQLLELYKKLIALYKS